MMLYAKDKSINAEQIRTNLEKALRNTCELIESSETPGNIKNVTKSYLCPCGYVVTVRRGNDFAVRSDACGL